MKEHTSDFKNQIKEMGREIKSIATYNNTELELFDVKYSFEGNILKSVMKQLEIECTEELEKGSIINYKMGLKINNSYEYIDYGNFIVKEVNKLEDTDHYRMICYDAMLNSMIDYVPVDIQYPTTIREYIGAICDALNISFANENDEFANYDRVLLVDPYEGLEYTYRDILDELAQVTASTICINEDDELEIRYIKSDTPGKNLLDISQTIIGKAWNWGSATNRAVCYMQVQPNTTYTLSYNTLGSLDALYRMEKVNYDDTTTTTNTQVTTNPQTFTTKTNSNWLLLQFNKTNVQLSDLTGLKIQIEQGNQATQYEDYKEYEIPDEIDENYLKDVNVDFGEKYGPVNSIVLSRSGESDNVFIQDGESVAENGICEIKIIDNQIMNFNDRSDYLPDILEKLDGLEYYINDFSSTGITYLDLLDRFNVNIRGNTYNCILFNDEQNINLGLEEIIHTDMPEQGETDYTKADKTDRKINQTYLIVDKQNQQIQSLVNQIGDRSGKTTTITQDVDSIELKISDIEDLTLEVTGTNPLMLENCIQGNLLQFRIKGNNSVFGGLAPSETLVPSNELVPSGGQAALELYVTGEQYIEDIMQDYTGKVAFNYYGQLISNDNINPSNTIHYIEVKPKTRYRIGVINKDIDTKLYISLWGDNFLEKLAECNEVPAGQQLFVSPKRFFSNWTEGGAGWDYSIQEYIIETGDEEYYIGLNSWAITDSDLQNISIDDKKTILLDIREPLRQLNASVYDEYVYDYESKIKSKVIRRVGVDNNGDLYELASEVTEEVEVEDLMLEEGTNYINIAAPYLASCYARYVQLNDFTKQFATTYQVESAITQLANSITLLVREKVNKEEVIAELNLEIAEGLGIVTITGNRVIINSDYFRLSANGEITATTGYIAGLEMWRHSLSSGMWSALTKTFTTTDTSRDSEGKYVSGLLIPDNIYGTDFIVAGMPYNGGAWTTSNAALRIFHDGTIYCKQINMNAQSGYVRMTFDSGRTALDFQNNQIVFKLDDNANTIFAAILQGQDNLQINLIGALGFVIYDELHRRTMYKADPRAGQAPYHYFTGEMWMDRDLDGTFVQVAQNGDWLSDEKLKKDIKDSKTNALDIIDNMKFKQFTWNDKTKKSGTHIDIGLIAQDIEKLDKNYVNVTPMMREEKQEDYLSIDVLNLLTTTTKAVQELSQKVKDLEEEIKKLKGEK